MSNLMNWFLELQDSQFPLMLQILSRITLILAVAWFLHITFRHWNPRLRILLWRTTAIGVICVVLIGFLPFRLMIPVLPSNSHEQEPLHSVAGIDLNEKSTSIKNEEEVPFTGKEPPGFYMLGSKFRTTP